MRHRCIGRARDVRSMWVFGLRGDELFRATRCRRPEGHRGECLRNPQNRRPPSPWRVIDYSRYDYPTQSWV